MQKVYAALWPSIKMLRFTVSVLLASLLFLHRAVAESAPVATTQQAESEGTELSADPVAEAEAAPTMRLYIREFRVQTATKLPSVQVEEAVYPYLGPGRTPEDVDKAAAALQEAYNKAGYSTVSVTIPPQSPKSGVILLKAEETPVGKLLIKGAKWHLPSRIRRKAKSMHPGNVLNFNDVQKEITALNKSADLRVTPELVPNTELGTVDMLLNVEDKLPLHGSLELNNRSSANTVPLRLNGALSYSNLWQLGHGIGFNFQIAPEDTKDAAVYSGFYSLPLTDITTLTFSGTIQDSDVSTLGGVNVLGRGNILGARATVTLPSRKASFYHSLNLGLDYKQFDEDVTVAGNLVQTPIEYFPFSAGYAAGWLGKKSFTELNMTVNLHFRGLGSERIEFDNKRFNADGSYIYLRGDVTHTHDLPGGFELLTKVQGQIANNPLINNEQYSAGGQSTVRGYLESTALGDNGVVGTLELRSPSFIGKEDEKTKQRKHEWRVYTFLEGARLTLHDALPEQIDRFDLASYGVGTRLKLYQHLNGSLDFSIPILTQGETEEGDPFLSFRVWTDF